MASEGSHDTKIIINSTLLTGVQNISFAQNIEESPTVLVGREFSSSQMTAPPSVTASIDKLLLTRDFVTGLTFMDLMPINDAAQISGQFIYGDNILDFNSGFLDGYSVQANNGQIPNIAFDFTIYGDFTGGGASREAIADQDFEMSEVSPTGITIVYDKDQTNAVQSFSFSETFPSQPVYTLGNKKPANIKPLGPISQQAVINIEVENYTPEYNFSFSDQVSGTRNRDVSIVMANKTGATNTFRLQNAHLVSESITAGLGDTVVANLTYNGFREYYPRVLD